MKSTLFFVFIVSPCLAQFEMPVNHNHGTANCYGFAMAKSFGKTTAEFCKLDKTTAPSMDTEYFTYSGTTDVPSYPLGAIIKFGTGVGTEGHVGVLTSKVGSTSTWEITQIPNESPNGPIEMKTLQEVSATQGSPQGYWTRISIPFYTVKVFSNSSGELVGVGFLASGAVYWHPSGTIFNVARESTTQLTAESGGFLFWIENGEISGTGTTKAITVLGNGEYKARYPSTISVDGTYIVAAGTTEEFVPEDVISITSGSRILVNGTLAILGNVSGHVSLASPAGSSWQGIEFSGSQGSVIRYCDINYALTPILSSDSNPVIEYTTMGNSSFGNYPHDAAMAFYGSSPTISGVTIWGQANSLNGVRFSQGSYGSMSNSTIDFLGEGNGIIVEGSSGPTISNNTIHGCKYHGILIPYAGGFPRIYDNRIESNVNQAYHGIRIDNSQAEVKGNIISDHNAGFWIDNQSFVRTPYSGDGLNQVYGNLYGIHLEDESDMEFGYVDPWAPSYRYGSCNQLYNNSNYNVHMEGFSYIWAHGNYWYPTPPSGIYSGGSGIEYDCFLQYYWDCESFVACGGSLMSVQSSGITMEDNDRILSDAQAARMRRDLTSSTALFKEVLNGDGTQLQQRLALRGLYRNYLDTQDQALLDLIEPKASTSSDVGVTASWLMLKLKAASERYDEAIGLAEGLIDAFPDSETEREALLFLAFLGGYDESRRAVSQSAISRLMSVYGDSLDKGLLTAISRKDAPGAAAEDNESGVALTLESSTYPNPFNPTTTISFTLPEDGLVSLRIYDALGRLITTIVNENRQAGPHSVRWDASHVPSGVYFSRLETYGRAVVSRLLLVR